MIKLDKIKKRWILTGIFFLLMIIVSFFISYIFLYKWVFYTLSGIGTLGFIGYIGYFYKDFFPPKNIKIKIKQTNKSFIKKIIIKTPTYYIKKDQLRGFKKW